MQVYDSYASLKEQVASKAASSRAQLTALQVPDFKGWEARQLDQPLTLYKVVASVNGKLVSAFDGETEYQIGRWTRSKHGACSWPPLLSCFYGFEQPEQALAAKFPKGSKHLKAPKVLLQVEGVGKAYAHSHTGMWAVPNVRPSRVIPGAVQSPQPAAPIASEAAVATARTCTPARASQESTMPVHVPGPPMGAKGSRWVP